MLHTFKKVLKLKTLNFIFTLNIFYANFKVRLEKLVHFRESWHSCKSAELIRSHSLRLFPRRAH